MEPTFSVWKTLARDPKFWTTLFMVVQLIVLRAWPTFPQDIWEAITLLMMVIFGAITGTQIVAKQRWANEQKRAMAQAAEQE